MLSGQARGPGLDLPKVSLGPRAPWLGLAVYAVAVAVFLLAVAFEARVAALRPGLEQTLPGAVVARFSVDEQVAHVAWRAGVLLLLLGAGLGAALVAGWCVVQRAGRAPLQIASILTLGVLALAARQGLVDAARTPSVLLELAALVRARAGEAGVAPMASLVLQPKVCAEAVAWLVGVAAASLAVLPAELGAAELARRQRALRVLLDASAALFAVHVLVTEAAYTWRVSFLRSEDGSALRGLAGLAKVGTRLSGAFHSLLLAAIYAPTAAVLELSARRLAAANAGLDADGGPSAWLERHGLHASWRGQLARVGSLLAPLVSSGLASALAAG